MKRFYQTRQVAEGGISTALILVLFALHQLLPALDIFINYLISLFIAILIIRLGRSAAFIVYLASALLAFIWPGPPSILAFVLIGGVFPFVKIICEQQSAGRRYGRTWSILIKLLIASGQLFFYFWIQSRFFLPQNMVDRVFALPFARLWIIPALLVCIALYDYLLSQGIDFYYHRLRPLLGRKTK